jgi:hypothetical protein
MKKIFIGFSIIILCSIISMSTVQQNKVPQNPFDSFMGMKWGMNAEKLETLFEEKYEYELEKYSQGFFFEGLQLGSVSVLTTSLGFKTAAGEASEETEEEIKFKKSNYSQFRFSFVFLDFDTNEFELMLNILKEKYGEPKSIKEYKILVTISSETEYSVENAFVKRQIATGETSSEFEVIQKDVMWEGNGRGILLSRFDPEDGTLGKVHFYKIDKDKLKKAGDIL